MRLVEYFLEPALTAMLVAGITGSPMTAGGITASPLPAGGITGSPVTAGPPAGPAPSAPPAPPPGAAELEAQVASLLDAARDKALLAGYERDHVEAADLAVCALLDETLLSSSWPGRETWLLRPLQRIRHATVTAGEDFYAVLDALLEQANGENLRMEPKEGARTENGPHAEKSAPASLPAPLPASLTAALEVFALCLSQGFTGMHFQNPAAVRQKLRALARLLPDLEEMLSANERENGRPLFFAARPEGAAPRRRDLFRLRFDALDWLLWLLPPLVLAVLYHVYASRLDALVEIIFAGKIAP